MDAQNKLTFEGKEEGNTYEPSNHFFNICVRVDSLQYFQGHLK
jgi:hypothetical protein